MSVQQGRGGFRWFCSRCEPRYEQWGPWGRPTTENIEAMREAERQHEWDWHTSQILKDAWGNSPVSQSLGGANPKDSEPR